MHFEDTRLQGYNNKRNGAIVFHLILDVSLSIDYGHVTALFNDMDVIVI